MCKSSFWAAEIELKQNTDNKNQCDNLPQPDII